MFSSCCTTADHVDDGLRDDRDLDGNWPKRIAVFGPAGSGKTTFINQLSCMFGDSGLDNSELRDARRRPSVFKKTKVYDHLEALLASSAYAAERQMLVNLRANAYNSEDDDDGLRRLRNDLAGVVAVPSVRKYFEELRDWCSSRYEIEYTPDFDYLIRAWDCILHGSVTPSLSELVPAFTVQTYDIHTHRFEYDNSKYVIYDLPGEREHRKHLMRLFGGANRPAIVYLVNLADYNQSLYVNNTWMRWEDSRHLYNNMLSDKRLAKVPFFVVGTMHDRLQSKLHRIPFADFAPQLDDESPPFDGDPLSADDVAEHRLSWYKEKWIYKSIKKLDPIPDGYRLLTVEEAREPRGLPLEASPDTLWRSFWLLDGGMIDRYRKITEGDFANDDTVTLKFIRKLSPLFSQPKCSARIKHALRESVGDVVYDELIELVCSYIRPNPYIISTLDPASVAEAFHHIHSSMRMIYEPDDEVKEIEDDEVNEIGDDEVSEIGDDEENETGVGDEVNEIGDNEVNKSGVDEEVSKIGVERSSRSRGKRCVVM